MKILFAAALLAAALIPAGACGGSGDLTVEEYFRKVETIDKEADQRVDDSSLLADDDSASSDDETFDDAERDRLENVFGELRDLFSDVINDLDDIEPPQEAEDAHREAVDSYRELADAIGAIADDVRNVDSFEELFALFSNPDYETATNRAEEACNELQRVADDNGIDVELQCGDEQE